jgi:hypothetical protein
MRKTSLELKRLLTLEIVLVIVVLVGVLIFVGVTPYLVSSKETDKIAVFNQKEYAQNTVSLIAGQKATCRFNYSTFDPAILVIDLDFQSWKTPGYLALYCNGILVVTIVATPNNPNVQLTTITVSGYDLVKPHYQLSSLFTSYAYGNEITFASAIDNGFEGIFSYTVSVRGSR